MEGSGFSCRKPCASCALHDVDAALTVDEVVKAARIDGHVVRRDALESLRRIRQEMADLGGAERIGDIDEPQALREPGEWNDVVAVQSLGRLGEPVLARGGGPARV